MSEYNYEKDFEILRDKCDMKTSASYGTTHYERINIELLDANYHSTKNLIKSIDDFNKSSNKLSNHMFWLTIATVVLALIQVAIGIISLIKL